ncbi:MAG: methylcrotonoyl-CoA carboxylase, partial [Erythrobacter sp.]|nr:methylcrotonoyl-CoA carboxylase [Erythrobacter sp.]
RVASGEPLPKRQDELSIKGHAIEARLYAEDPAKGFLPSTGRLEYLAFHESWRVDSGVTEGDEISPYYDPMIAKVIVTGDDRAEALLGLKMSFYRTAIAPLRTNAGFLYRLVQLPEFVNGQLDTGLIERNLDKLTLPDDVATQLTEDAATAIVASELHDSMDLRPGIQVGLEPTGLPVWRAAIGFRLNADTSPRVSLYRDGEHIRVPLPDNFRTRRMHSYFGEDGRVSVMRYGETLTFAERPPSSGQASAADGAIIAPMPGKVIAVDVAEGQAVTAGQRLLVLEAMKMEHALTAPFDGVIEGLAVSAGSQVQVEAVLCKVVPE